MTAGLVGEPMPLTGPELSESAFRRACAQFPTGVTVVTAAHAGDLHGSTVNAFSSLTLAPAQVLVCLARTSRTWPAIERSRRFAVNVLARDQVDVARLFATKEPDKLARVPHRSDDGAPPVLHGAAAWFECDLADAITSHTHRIVIGRVVRLMVDEDRDPLVFARGRLDG
ncbi:flavin reductase family protein [Nocardioides sp. L-11A]|uniref:flavin reductase family protein n=1 Tax=Nocardioides sp. L-11A TaxID=3043848 RepID=UPI00249CF1FC|nr:flavin reductase family protein [Nocardioides sp. L-11A]